MDTTNLLRDMENAARCAGSLILSAHDIKTERKSGRRDLVTDYDRAVQKMIMEDLSKKYPSAGFVCEENNVTYGFSKEFCFIVDPIDGTANFSKNYRRSCISIACLRDGSPIFGTVFDPYLDEMFSASSNGGAFLNGVPIQVTEDTVSDSIVIFGTSPYNPELTELTFDRLRRVFNKCLDVRRTGSAALDLCYAAAGRCGVFFEGILALWDYAAAALIVKEAGGICVTMDGNALDYRTIKTSMIAGPERNVRYLLELFAQ